MMQCEYKIVRGSLKDEDTESKLMELAQQGWRLVCAVPHGSNARYIMELDHGRVGGVNSEREMV